LYQLTTVAVSGAGRAAAVLEPFEHRFPKERRTDMRQAQRWGVACVGLLVGLGVLGIGGGYTAENEDKEVKLPAVFQAAGTTAEAIQSTVDAFRAALGEPNNANDPGPLPEGRREINWDGGGADETTTPPVTPFDVFLSTRGAQFTSPATGLTQAPPAGGPQGGLAALFTAIYACVQHKMGVRS
jgi:hypothetical protein